MLFLFDVINFRVIEPDLRPRLMDKTTVPK